MKLTVKDVRRAIEKAGGTMEEDEGYRDMRTLQAVAPDGKLWACGSLHCLRIEWATGRTAQAQAYNGHEYRDLEERLACGLEDDPEWNPDEDAPVKPADPAPGETTIFRCVAAERGGEHRALCGGDQPACSCGMWFEPERKGL